MIINHDFKYDGLPGRIVYRSGEDYEGNFSSKIEIQIQRFYGYTKKEIIDKAKRSFPEREMTRDQLILRTVLRIDPDVEKNVDITETLK